MWTIGSFAFVEPLILLALAGLPVLWWLLRQTPPAPQRLNFPAIRLLLDLIPKEETPHRTPWWLILLRMVIAAILIVALAHPLINPLQNFTGSGPLLLAVDNGWAAAPHWQERQAAMEEWIERADRQGVPVQILATAPGGDGQPVALTDEMAGGDAKRVAQGLTPEPWPTDRAAATRALGSLPDGAGYNVVWLTDGVGTGKDDASEGFAARLGQLGNVTVLRNAPEDLALLMLPPPIEPGAFELRIARPEGGPARRIAIRATGSDGRLIAREEMTIGAGETLSKHRMRLPAEMRNRIARLDIEGQSSAGAAILLDEGWRQRPVGLVGQEEASATQPLLGDIFYLERAMAPFAELHRGNIDQLVQSKLAVLVLADVGTLSEVELQKLTVWVENGGVLLRFAGNWLAQKPDGLLPVQLRGTDRAMGGAMSWSEPLTLAAFPQHSPFAGLPVPEDVVVRRQVLAEPDINLGDKTWARLSDGTPLVTGARRG
ncbi:MAG TPA: BatA domain-containing protein, partial [Dongiaceae bacterium]